MHRFAIPTILVCVLLTSPCWAQEQQNPEPEHKLLHKFVGEWDTSAEGTVDPNQPPIKCEGQIKARMLGEFWVISEATTEMMGTKISSIQTIGYDAKLKKYVGTWVDSMMNHMWKYEGTVDKAGQVLTLEADGPSFTQEGATSKYRDVYEFKSDDQFLLLSQVQDESGKWITFMTGTATRRK